MVEISMDTESLGRNYAFSMGIVANTKMAMRQLIDELKSQATEAQLKSIADARMANAPNAGNIRLDPALRGQTPMHCEEFATILDQNIDPEAIVCREQNQAKEQYMNYGHRAGEKTRIRLDGGSLGWGVGASAGVKLAEPNRQVVAWLGDGGTMFGACGFWTQARNEIPVLSVVANNHNYETVRLNYERYQGRMAAANRYTGMMLDCPHIDFVGLAKVEGCDGIRVETAADMPAALKRGQEAVAAGAPFLVEVDIARQLGPAQGGLSTWHQEFSLAQLRTRKV
jgi:thiamine pyrophosphate-dependent acetolactate synthase large subunit-like protein